MEARSNEYSAANCYLYVLLFGISIYVLQPEKGFRELPFIKEKIMRLSWQLVSRVWRSVLPTIGIAENAFTVGLSAGLV